MKYTMYFAGLIACFFSIVAAQAQESKFLNSPARKLQLAEFAIANLYVDEVNEGKLVEEAIVKMLEQLDPHSTYSDPEEVKRMNEPLQGNFEVDASYMIKDKIGYIRINRFAATTHEEFKKALTGLQKKGMKDLILDLQGNGGGYLNAAIDIANEFLGKKELIVYTEGRRNPRSEFFAKGTGEFQNGRLMVLVDEFSASASEIVTGAVQDWDRGVVVGRRSFGKGLVQRPIDLPDGSMIRLTVARYYTPAGRCIQKPYESIEKYNEDLIDRYNKGEMMSEDSIHFPGFEVTPDMLAQLVATGKEMGVEYNEEEYQKALPLLRLQMKALIARDLWDMNEYYHVINDANESIRKALELLEQPDFEGLLLKKR